MHITTVLIKWISNLTDKTSAALKQIPLQYFNNFGENFAIFSMNLDNIKNLNNINIVPEFYQNIIKAWIEMVAPKNLILKTTLRY